MLLVRPGDIGPGHLRIVRIAIVSVMKEPSFKQRRSFKKPHVDATVLITAASSTFVANLLLVGCSAWQAFRPTDQSIPVDSYHAGGSTSTGSWPQYYTWTRLALCGLSVLLMLLTFVVKFRGITCPSLVLGVAFLVMSVLDGKACYDAWRTCSSDSSTTGCSQWEYFIVVGLDVVNVIGATSLFLCCLNLKLRTMMKTNARAAAALAEEAAGVDDCAKSSQHGDDEERQLLVDGPTSDNKLFSRRSQQNSVSEDVAVTTTAAGQPPSEATAALGAGAASAAAPPWTPSSSSRVAPQPLHTLAMISPPLEEDQHVALDALSAEELRRATTHPQIIQCANRLLSIRVAQGKARMEKEGAVSLDTLAPALGLVVVSEIGCSGLRVVQALATSAGVRASVIPGDIIMYIGNGRIFGSSPDRVLEELRSYRAGDMITLDLIRGTDARLQTLSVELGSYGCPQSVIRQLRREAGLVVPDTVLYSSADARRCLRGIVFTIGFMVASPPVSREGGGLIAKSIVSGGPASKCVPPLSSGDIILSIDQQPMDSPADFYNRLQEGHLVGDIVEVAVEKLRGGNQQYTIMMELAPMSAEAASLELVRSLRYVAGLPSAMSMLTDRVEAGTLAAV